MHWRYHSDLSPQMMELAQRVHSYGYTGAYTLRYAKALVLRGLAVFDGEPGYSLLRAVKRDPFSCRAIQGRTLHVTYNIEPDGTARARCGARLTDVIRTRKGKQLCKKCHREPEQSPFTPPTSEPMVPDRAAPPNPSTNAPEAW